ncbi:hypothetical protein ICW40_18830, partial [Actinotalea ferrariae]|uniref:hypothetical protein n=1 Tax=Actinotalea ferrariae TaxID=1386098 RepID=UPI001C8BD91B
RLRRAAGRRAAGRAREAALDALRRVVDELLVAPVAEVLDEHRRVREVAAARTLPAVRGGAAEGSSTGEPAAASSTA